MSCLEGDLYISIEFLQLYLNPKSIILCMNFFANKLTNMPPAI